MQNKLTIFETAVIGLFIGVIVASYETYISYSNAVIGNIIKYITLSPLFSNLFEDSNSLVLKFVFTVSAFLIYGIISGLLIKIGSKGIIILIVAILILLSGFIEQVNLPTNMELPLATSNQSLVNKAIVKQQYFGFEAYGDLNGDNKDDIAFIIQRDDKDRGQLFYLSSAIKSEVGNTGTNLVFLGNNIKPQNITIKDRNILIDYTNNSTSTKTLTAYISDNHLVLASSTEQ